MEFDNVEAMKSVVAVELGASTVPSLSLGRAHSSGEYACAATQSTREPTGRIDPTAWKTKQRWYGARLRGIVILTAPGRVRQINIDVTSTLTARMWIARPQTGPTVDFQGFRKGRPTRDRVEA
jgi:hypothetical protein